MPVVFWQPELNFLIRPNHIKACFTVVAKSFDFSVQREFVNGPPCVAVTSIGGKLRNGDVTLQQ